MDFKIARHNMVYQQVRPWDVSNLKILSVLDNLPRERFVLEHFKHLAYSDTSLPIGQDQYMLSPKMVGKILQALQLNKEDAVLEIGTGTGYLTAALAELAKRVVTIESQPELLEKAKENLANLHITNVQFELGDGLQGYKALAPFSVIVLTGSLPFLPRNLLEQLSTHGRLFAIVGKEPLMSAVLLTKIKEEGWQEETLFETLIPPLNTALKKDNFKF